MNKRNKKSRLAIIAGAGIALLGGAYIASENLSQEANPYVFPSYRVEQLKFQKAQATSDPQYQPKSDPFSIITAEESDALGIEIK